MSDIAEVHEARPGYLHALASVCAGIILEYRRAMAAETQYVSLKRESDTALAHEGTVRSDIPRRVFEEFYSNRQRSSTSSPTIGSPKSHRESLRV